MRDLLVSDYRAPTSRDRHVDALASLRAMPTAVLLGAMRVRRVLRERGVA